jgi:DNA topoisomerase.
MSGKSGKVVELKKEKKTAERPLLYDLTELDMKKEFPGLLNAIKTGYSAAAVYADKILSQGINVDKHVIDDRKVSDHHAIIVTSEIAHCGSKSLSSEESNVLNLIITRLLVELSNK